MPAPVEIKIRDQRIEALTADLTAMRSEINQVTDALMGMRSEINQEINQINKQLAERMALLQSLVSRLGKISLCSFAWYMLNIPCFCTSSVSVYHHFCVQFSRFENAFVVGRYHGLSLLC